VHDEHATNNLKRMLSMLLIILSFSQNVLDDLRRMLRMLRPKHKKKLFPSS
jgi:hypothetical protein